MTEVVKPIIPVESYDHTISEEDAYALFELMNTLNLDQDPDYIPPPNEQRLKSLRKPHPFVEQERYMIRKDDTIIATADYSYFRESHPAYEANKELVMMDINVHPSYRKQGLAKALLKHMAPGLRELNKSKLITSTSTDAGKAVLEHYGGKSALAGAENRLYLDEVDWNMIDEWIEQGPKRAEGVILQEFTRLPDDIGQEFMDVYTETMMQQPLGDLDVDIKEDVSTRRQMEERFEELGVLPYTLITREADGAISGLTELYYNPGTPHKISQNLTGVKQEYRGKGLGKWLKAELLKRVKERHPEIKYVITGNADSNAPMLSINERMGFKRFKSDYSFIFVTSELLEKFSS